MKTNYFMVIILATLISAGTSFLVITNMSQGSDGGVGKEDLSLYEETLSTGKIQAAYFVGAPYFIKDPNTKEISGIFAEVVESAFARIGVEVDWVEEVGFGDMVAGLEANRYDIVGSGIWVNSTRGKMADFSTPVLYDVVGTYVRQDDERFDKDLSILNSPKYKISTIDGEMASIIAKTDFPEAQVLSLPQMSDFSQMILNIVNKKADITFLGLASANNYLSSNPNSLKNLNPDSPIRVFPTAIMFSTGEYEFKRLIDFAIEEMHNNGEIESIIEKYEDFPGSHYRIAHPFRY